jgi:aminotransferase
MERLYGDQRMKRLAERTAELIQSDIRAVSRMVDAVGGINLGQGICDLPTTAVIRGAACGAIERNRSTYSSYSGIATLRSFIARKLREFNRIPVTSEEEIVVTVVSTGAFAMAMLAMLDPGDEVILFEPFYGYHTNLVAATGGVPVTVLQSGPAWEIDFDEILTAVTSRTKAVVVTTPGNPHGKVWTRQELATLLEIAERHDLWIVTDEIYEYMTYDDNEHVSMASLDGAQKRTITISGFSKTYNMTGWRLGYATARDPIIEKMGLLNDLFYICAPTPLQHGVAAAGELPTDFYEQLRQDYAAKRQLMCSTLAEVGFDVPWPQGAYYVLADFERLAADRGGFEDDRVACQTLIDRCGVGTVAGSAFFTDPFQGRFRLRFCFAKEYDELAEACDRLRRGLAL